MTQSSNELHFFYDAQNKPAVVVYNGTPYSYVKNLQGDIVAILDSSKNVVVSYVYDAWGRPISCSGTMASTLGKINPFRYRGYVYDEETGLYYLRSRYYASTSCRFINADTYLGQLSKLFSHTLFSYCRNAPVSKADLSGYESSNVDDTNYGAAQEYVYCDDPNINCLAYVLGESVRRNLWTINGNFDVYNVGSCLVTELTADGYSIRGIDTYDSAIDMDEYRIALRTTKPIDITILGVQIYSKSGDFHFMVQHNDGSWSHKPGWAPSMLLNEDNPSDATWPYYREMNGKVKQLLFWETYGSDTLYYAIKRPVEE